jgi:hypothetical protein
MHPSKVTLRPKVRRPMARDSTKSAPSALAARAIDAMPHPRWHGRAELDTIESSPDPVRAARAETRPHRGRYSTRFVERYVHRLASPMSQSTQPMFPVRVSSERPRREIETSFAVTSCVPFVSRSGTGARRGGRTLASHLRAPAETTTSSLGETRHRQGARGAPP